MIKEKRIDKIEKYVIEHSSVSLDELMSEFKVSKNTIRRDIQVLLETGTFKKVYGGVAVKHKNLESFQERRIQNKNEKALIAERAAQYIEDGESIFIDSGTTTLEMFDYLKDKSLTVITNNLEFIIRSLPYPNLNVIAMGGMLERKTNSLVNPQRMDLLQAYNIHKAFMATTGITLSNGVTNASPIETELKKTMVNRSKDVFLLADHAKFDRYGLMTYCSLQDIDYLITNRVPNKDYEDFIKGNHIRLEVVGR
jgi:DeoR family transcriptional regulator, myo-inositol catabolism operon repressor